ncbi:MAG: DedA family protein [Chloroflexi bacterium]|nr:DedA family protein [Chloroflexota bacterium]
MTEAIEHQLLRFIASVYEAMGWPGVVLLMAIESASIPLPSELIMPLSGWMLIQAKGLSVWHILLAGFYGALGNLLGSLLAYWLGAWGGRPLLEKYGRYVLITRADLDKADKWFAKYGDWAVLISRMLPVVRTFISFPAGVVKMRIVRFSLLTFAGSFPWSVGLAFGGYVLGENWEALRRVMRPFDIPIVAAIVAVVAFYVYRRIRHVRAEGRESVPKTPS